MFSNLLDWHYINIKYDHFNVYDEVILESYNKVSKLYIIPYSF